MSALGAPPPPFPPGLPFYPPPSKPSLQFERGLQQPKSKPAFNIRQAGEGEQNAAQLKKMIKLRKEVKEQKGSASGDESTDVSCFFCFFFCNLHARLQIG